MTKTFSKIVSDKTSGSLEILMELHEHLKAQSSFIKIFPNFIESVEEKFPTFQNIQIYLREMKKSLSKNKLDEFFFKYDNLLDNIYDKIFFKCKDELKNFNRILTISNSKTLFEIFVRLKKINPHLKIILCESRPKFEGRIFAKKLLQNKIKVEMITEAMIFSSIKKIDAGIIGADAILKNGDVINKVGSSLIAISCKNFNKPCFVIADKSKIKSSNKFNQKEMPPEEIWRHSPKNIVIKNFYFEQIDKSLITKIISD